MIKNSKQVREPGNIVKVGFLTLHVVEKVATPGDYAPDAYVLTNLEGTRVYRFVPHKGLTRFDTIEQARDTVNYN